MGNKVVTFTEQQLDDYQVQCSLCHFEHCHQFHIVLPPPLSLAIGLHVLHTQGDTAVRMYLLALSLCFFGITGRMRHIFVFAPFNIISKTIFFSI